MSRSENHDSFSISQWKRQLDLDRPCGAVSSGETCWLCDNFMAWNSAIEALGLELAETRPGTLRLQSVSNRHVARHPVAIAFEASRLASRLLCHHPCIQELSLACSMNTESPVGREPFSIHLRPPSVTLTCRRLRLLSINEAPDSPLALQDMDAISGLEKLIIVSQGENQYFADEINAVMERNQNTLKDVDICEYGVRRKNLRRLEVLVACEFLTLNWSFSEDVTRHVDEMASLIRVSTTLKEVTAQPIPDEDLSAIAMALEINCSLTKLSLNICAGRSIEQLFRAVEVSKNLKELFLCGNVYVEMTCMRAVASALANNHCLRALSIEGLSVHDAEGLGQWWETLSKNSTLEFLCIGCSSIPISEVSALCKALSSNKCLKTLKLVGVMGTEEERTSLARQLLEDKCYDRVELKPLREAYLRILAPVLGSSQAYTRELRLSEIDQLSHDSVSVLCNALASSKKVNRLTVTVKREHDEKVILLCNMLKKNKSIDYLWIDIQNENSASAILRALTTNTGISHIQMYFLAVPLEETTAALCGMLLRNKAITRVSGRIFLANLRRLMGAFTEALSGNRLIVDWSCAVLGCDTEYPPSVFRSVLRNRAALNRAVDFVLQRRVDRHCAECFELFFGRACLMTKLVEVTGMSAVEARIVVDAAENRRREWYLTLTGVVRRSVVCWPADVTQLDALNSDCWRTIASYLMVTDVPSR